MIYALAKKMLSPLLRLHFHLTRTRKKAGHRGLSFPDRVLLEDVILPYLAVQPHLKDVLFIGCEWYTAWYRNVYFKDKNFTTIEIDPVLAKFGSPQAHITDGIQHLDKYMQPAGFDLIIYNGVFGWGVNSRKDAEDAFRQIRKALRPGGLLLFGWDDIPERKPFDVLTESEELKHFAAYHFPPLNTAAHRVTEDGFRHTYNFYALPVQRETL